MLAKSYGSELNSKTVSKFGKRKTISRSLVFRSLSIVQDGSSSRRIRATKETVQKCVLRVQSCCFAYINFCIFAVLVAVTVVVA